jgi:hypothetical protein
MTPKIRKKVKKKSSAAAGCSLLMAEGFSCNLDVLYGGPGGSKNVYKKISTVIFFLQF